MQLEDLQGDPSRSRGKFQKTCVIKAYTGLIYLVFKNVFFHGIVFAMKFGMQFIDKNVCQCLHTMSDPSSLFCFALYLI